MKPIQIWLQVFTSAANFQSHMVFLQMSATSRKKLRLLEESYQLNAKGFVFTKGVYIETLVLVILRVHFSSSLKIIGELEFHLINLTS